VLFGYNLNYYTQRHILHKQPWNKTFIYFLRFGIFFLILGTFLSCEDKKKSSSTSQTNKITNTASSKTYTISDDKNKQHKITLNQKILLFENVKQTILVVHIFDSTKHSSKAQIDTFNTLEDTFKTKISIRHIPIDNASNPENKQFLDTLCDNIHSKAKKHLPLVVIFKNNHYYSHFEGIPPVEMIRYDIQQALKK